MANFVITSSANSFLIEIDGKKAPFLSGDVHPYTPDGSGATVYLYEIKGVLKNMGRASSVSSPNLSKDRVIMEIGVDNIDVEGVTVFADADALLEALREVFFLASPDSPLIPDGQRVDTYADLPDPVASDGQYWVVDTQTGTWILGTRREAGIYKAVSGAWVYRGADVPYYLMDDQFTIKDSTDNSKQLGFEVGDIATANRRIATWQDKNIVVADNADVLSGIIRVTQANVAATLGGVIDSTKLYFVEEDIDTAGVTCEVPAGGITVTGHGANISKLRCADPNYTMFLSIAGGSGDFIHRELTICTSGANSMCYDLKSATGFSVFDASRVIWTDCTSRGRIDNYAQGTENVTVRNGGTPQLELIGNWLRGYVVNTSQSFLLTDGAYSLYKAGAGLVLNGRFRSNENADLPASASLIDFAPANFASASTFQLIDCLVTRNGVQNAADLNLTPNITAAALVCFWDENTGLDNTYVGGKNTVTTEIQTVIPGPGVYVDIAGTWTPSDLQHFSSPSNGALAHDGSSPINYKISVNVDMDAGSNNELTLRILKWDNANSVFVEVGSLQRTANNFVGGRDVAFFNMPNYFTTLSQGDFVKLQIRNDSGGTGVTAEIDSVFNIEER